MKTLAASIFILSSIACFAGKPIYDFNPKFERPTFERRNTGGSNLVRPQFETGGRATLQRVKPDFVGGGAVRPDKVHPGFVEANYDYPGERYVGRLPEKEFTQLGYNHPTLQLHRRFAGGVRNSSRSSSSARVLARPKIQHEFGYEQNTK